MEKQEQQISKKQINYSEETIKNLVDVKNGVLIEEIIDLRELLSLQKCSKENILLSALRCYKRSLTRRINKGTKKKPNYHQVYWARREREKLKNE